MMYNKSVHSTTGCSPNTAIFGTRNPGSEIDLKDQRIRIRKMIKARIEKDKRSYAIPPEEYEKIKKIEKGTKVMIRYSEKQKVLLEGVVLQDEGLYALVERIPKTVKNNDEEGKRSVIRCKKIHLVVKK